MQRNYLRDVSFQAIAWIQTFMKSKFPHFHLFQPVLEAFSPDSHIFFRLFPSGQLASLNYLLL